MDRLSAHQQFMMAMAGISPNPQPPSSSSPSSSPPPSARMRVTVGVPPEPPLLAVSEGAISESDGVVSYAFMVTLDGAPVHTIKPARYSALRERWGTSLPALLPKSASGAIKFPGKMVTSRAARRTGSAAAVRANQARARELRAFFDGMLCGSASARDGYTLATRAQALPEVLRLLSFDGDAAAQVGNTAHAVTRV
jgi:hypothetical protein